MEIWKDVEGYEGLYQVSNEGRVKSLERFVESVAHGKPCIRHLQEKIMKPTQNKRHIYKQLALAKDGVKEMMKIHRLVWETFVSKIPDGYEIDHINTVRTDNRLENLRCVTPKENRNNPLTLIHMSEAFKGRESPMLGKHHTAEAKEKQRCKAMGRHHTDETKKKMSSKRKGSGNPMFGKKNTGASDKLSKDIVEIKSDGTCIEWKSIADACKFYGFTNSGNISNCCNGKYMRSENHYFKGSYWFFKNSDSL